MAPVQIADQVAISTAASKVPLRVEDPSAIRVIAEVFKPRGDRHQPARQVAA